MRNVIFFGYLLSSSFIILLELLNTIGVLNLTPNLLLKRRKTNLLLRRVRFLLLPGQRYKINHVLHF